MLRGCQRGPPVGLIPIATIRRLSAPVRAEKGVGAARVDRPAALGADRLAVPDPAALGVAGVAPQPRAIGAPVCSSPAGIGQPFAALDAVQAHRRSMPV